MTDKLFLSLILLASIIQLILMRLAYTGSGRHAGKGTVLSFVQLVIVVVIVRYGAK